MNWNTIYIIGNDDFWEDVNKKLSHSNLDFLTGYVEQLPNNKHQGLYWLDNQVSLREFKEAIGGKLVWKYRLTFLNELEQVKPKTDIGEASEFSAKENALIQAMRRKNPLAA
jgi:hypothetical protein